MSQQDKEQNKNEEQNEGENRQNENEKVNDENLEEDIMHEQVSDESSNVEGETIELYNDEDTLQEFILDNNEDINESDSIEGDQVKDENQEEPNELDGEGYDELDGEGLDEEGLGLDVKIEGEGDELNDETQNQEDIENGGQEENVQDDAKITLNDHNDSVYSVAFCPTKPFFASGGGDDVGYIYRLEDYSYKKLEGHTDTINKISFNYEGDYLASCGLDANIRIWNTETGELVNLLEGASESIESVAWHPKGPVLIAGGGDGLGWLWNARNGKIIAVLTGHSGPINVVAYTNDTRRVITGSQDGTIKIWKPINPNSPDVNLTSKLYNFHDEEEPIICLAVHPTSNLILSGSSSSSVITNIETEKVVAKFSEHSDFVESCLFTETLPLAITGSLDGKILIWDINTLQKRDEILLEGGVVKILNPANSNNLYSCSLDNCIKVFDVRNGKQIHKFTGHTSNILDFDVNKEETLIISGSDDKKIKIFDLKFDKKD